MAASFVVSVFLQLGLGLRSEDPREFAWIVLITVAVSTATWLAALLNLMDWAAGCVLVYASLFGIGKILFGETTLGLGMLALAAAAGGLIYLDLERRGWRMVAE